MNDCISDKECDGILKNIVPFVTTAAADAIRKLIQSREILKAASAPKPEPKPVAPVVVKEEKPTPKAKTEVVPAPKSSKRLKR